MVKHDIKGTRKMDNLHLLDLYESKPFAAKY